MLLEASPDGTALAANLFERNRFGIVPKPRDDAADAENRRDVAALLKALRDRVGGHSGDSVLTDAEADTDTDTADSGADADANAGGRRRRGAREGGGGRGAKSR